MRKACYIVIMILVVMFCQGNAAARESDGIVVVKDISEHGLGAKRTVKKLDKPIIGSVVATSTATIKLMWIPVKNAQKYEIYRSATKKGGYKKIGTTKKTTYTDKKGKQLKTYYYKIRAVYKDKISGKNIYSPYSTVMKKKVRKIAQKTAYAGDSLMVGMVSYRKIIEGKSQQVFAKVGITTSAYYKSDLLTELLDYAPDRLYIMLGVNDLAGNPSEHSMNTIISYYEAILKSCIEKNPDMEIFVMGVSPVGKESKIRMDKVNAYNAKMEKKLSELNNVYYYDLALDLAGEDGYLKPKFAASDGLHWTPKTYDTVLKAIKELAKAY